MMIIFFGEDGATCILLNEKEEIIYILNRNNLDDDYKINEIKFNQIVESGIIEDEQTVTKTSKSGMLGRSLLGGVVAGGVGAIIGGVTANNTSTEQVKKSNFIYCSR